MKIKKILSLVLAIAMCASMLSGLTLTASAKMLDGNVEKTREVAGEGMVLLKNESLGSANALPLASTDTVAMFGIGQIVHAAGRSVSNPGYAFNGGGSANVGTGGAEIDPLEGLNNAVADGKIKMDTTIADIYETYRTNTVNKDEATEITADVINEAATRANTAVIMISRFSQEGNDREVSNASSTTSYYLETSEITLINNVKAAGFEKVVVVLNVPGVTDTSWFKDDADIDAALVIWLPGMQGGNAMWDVLCGTVNPSGKLADTFASSLDDYISTQSFVSGDAKTKPIYLEDIFVGYRQFETFDPNYEKVNYEFGFGLSYTDFTITDSTVTVDEDAETIYGNGEVTVTAKVTNTGSVAGKEVVQVYTSAPQGALGKAAKELKGFAKTSLLAPGASETVTITFPLYYMASYDDRGKTDYKSAYVLEAGDYDFYVGNSVKNVTKADTYTVAETTLVQQLTQYLTPVQDFDIYKADGTMETVTAGTDTSQPPAYTGTELTDSDADTDVKFVNVITEDNTMEEYVAELSTTQLAKLVAGYDVDEVSSDIPEFKWTDGPAGANKGAPATLWPCETLVACTFNEPLIEEMGTKFGAEVLLNDYDIVLMPGLNIHRNPRGGRNFEYMSEDPILTGKMGAALVRGVQSNEVSAEIKHFAANSQETQRYYYDSIVTERALREIYIKGFEIAVREGKPWSVMTSYNKFNGEWASHRYDLVTNILRGEWGHDGRVSTDWEGVVEILPMALSGNDFRLGSPDKAADTTTLVNAVEAGTITKAQLQEEAINILNVVARTAAKYDVYSTDKTDISSTVFTKLDIASYATISNVTTGTDDEKYLGDTKLAFSGTNAYAEYNVNVEADGNYLFEIRGKSSAANTLKILVDDIEVATASHASTSSVYKNRDAITVPLTAGDHVVKFLIESASGYHINYIMIAPETASVVEVSKDDTTTMFEAESAAELGGGAAVEDIIGTDGGQQVWNLMQGTYLTYNLNVDAATTKLLSARIIKDDISHINYNEGSFSVYLDDNLMGNITNYDVLNDYSYTDQLEMDLKPGRHTLKFEFSNGGMKMDNVQLVAPGTLQMDKTGAYLRLKAADIITKASCVLGSPNGTDLYPAETQIGTFGNSAYVTYKVYVPATGYYNLEATGQGLYNDAVIDVYVDDSSVPASSINDGSLYIGGSEYLNTKYNKSTAVPTFITKGYHTIKFQCDYASADAFNVLFFDFAKATYTISGDITAVDDGATIYIYQADADGVALTEIPFASTVVSNNRYNFSLVRNGRYVIEAGDTSVSVTVADANVTAAIE